MASPLIAFDDGHRLPRNIQSSKLSSLIPQQQTISTTSTSNILSSCPRGATSICSYYEVHRVAQQVVDHLDWSARTTRGRLLSNIQNQSATRHMDSEREDILENDLSCRVALQLPSECFVDATCLVCMLEDAIANSYIAKFNNLLLQLTFRSEEVATADTIETDSTDNLLHEIVQRHCQNLQPFVFLLGDSSDYTLNDSLTTFTADASNSGDSCCPDEIAARHLDAHILIHYGHACFTVTEHIPVIYSFFGREEMTSSFIGTKKIQDSHATSMDFPSLSSPSVPQIDLTSAIVENCVKLVTRHIYDNNGDLYGENRNNRQSSESLNEKEEETHRMSESSHLRHRQSTPLNVTKQTILLLYDTSYHTIIDELQSSLKELCGMASVVAGKIPHKPSFQQNSFLLAEIGSSGILCEGQKISSGCCTLEQDDKINSCMHENEASSDHIHSSKINYFDCVYNNNVTNIEKVAIEATLSDSCNSPRKLFGACHNYLPRTMGGLEIPYDLDLSQLTLLYIGDDFDVIFDSKDINSNDGQSCSTTATTFNTRVLQILLRSQSPDGPLSIWSYSPMYRTLNPDILNTPISSRTSNRSTTTVSNVLSRFLRRRYFLIQKAKLANTIGILIGTASASYSFRRQLAWTRRRIHLTGRTAYTFVVGKLSSSSLSSKLNNFAEIECFVLLACSTKIAHFWRVERDEMRVPVVTLMELDIALGWREWDGRYSCDFGDWIRWENDEEEEKKDRCELSLKDVQSVGENNVSDNGEEEEDEPFFSTISGKYECVRGSLSKLQSSDSDLQLLPGKGSLIEYRSEAAEFLKHREYKGLDSQIGLTHAQPAVLGKIGIASDYGEKVTY